MTESCAKFSGQPRDLWPDRPESPRKFFKYSPLLGLFQCVVFVSFWISLNELFKAFFMFAQRHTDTCAKKIEGCSNKNLCTTCHKAQKRSRSLGIDAYMAFKWATVAWLWLGQYNGPCALYFTVFLLLSNLFGYFYYHVWKHEDKPFTIRRERRRFLSFMLSFFFSIFAFAYLFDIQFADDILLKATDCGTSMGSAIMASLANAFTLTYDWNKPLTQAGYNVMTSQVVYSFIFLVIIIANSIPGPKNNGS